MKCYVSKVKLCGVTCYFLSMNKGSKCNNRTITNGVSIYSFKKYLWGVSDDRNYRINLKLEVYNTKLQIHFNKQIQFSLRFRAEDLL